MIRLTRLFAAGAATATATVLASCASDADADETIEISGSATVQPITAAVARDLGDSVSQEATGTLNGFEEFCSGGTDINNASEAIPGPGQNVDYMSMCDENGVEYVELPVAFDTLSLIRNNDNTAVDDVTLSEIQAIWAPDSDITTWSDVRPEWPDEEINLVGRGHGSATFDYFTNVAVGADGDIRDDYEVIDDPEDLSQAVAEDPWALGFTGVGSYLAAADHRDDISTVTVDGVEPSLENSQDGSYSPLTRPLFIYVSLDALQNKDSVEDFVTGYLDKVAETVPRVYFYPLPDAAYDQVRSRFVSREVGSLFDGDPHSGEDVTELLGH